MINLKKKLEDLPKVPGVYLMKDSQEKIIYVGKAKNLKNRVQNYFTTASHGELKTKKLVQKIADFEIIIVKSNLEALLLEQTLIKKHTPFYNVLLRDDKSYPYVRVDINSTWPRIKKVRRTKNDGALYLGPYVNQKELRTTLDLVFQIFPIVRCTESEFRNRSRPCPYYNMKLCLGPCTLNVDNAAYHKVVAQAINLIKGQHTSVISDLKKEMNKESTNENFEKAARIRNQIQAITKIKETQNVIFTQKEYKSMDVFSLSRQDQLSAVNVLRICDGKVQGQENFLLKDCSEDEQIIFENAIFQFYQESHKPKKILVALDLDNKDVLSKALEEKSKKPEIITPQIGNKKKLIEMSLENARYFLKHHPQLKKTNQTEEALNNIQKKFFLKNFPQHIECIDVSNLHKDAIVASVVCFKDANPRKKDYRIYNIKTVSTHPNDYKSIQEVMKRRLEKIISKEIKPDLIIIDGGKGQLSSASLVLDQYPDLNIDLISIAKAKTHGSKNPFEDQTTSTKERIFTRNHSSEMSLEPGSFEYKLFTSIRNEAHRFAIGHHRKKRSHQSLSSQFDDIPGVGPVLKKRILEKFPDSKTLKNATEQDLEKIPGLSLRVIRNLKNRLR